MLANKLVNYASEINHNLEAQIFKQLASGEPTDARLPYEKPFMLKDYAKLVFNANELPKAVEQTEAFFRRFLIVPFDVTIPAEKRNPNLPRQIIDNELPGVLNWVLQGLDRILKNEKFSRCTIIEERLRSYRSESDSVYLFIEERGYAPAENYTSDYQKAQKELYREYKDFCKDDGYRPLSNRNFAVRLEKLGYERKRTKRGQVFFVEHTGVDRTPF
jgi:putative DNA primase/helicase